MIKVYTLLSVMLLLLTTLLSCEQQKSNIGSQSQYIDHGLKFDDNGEFKIAQFTDIHWKEHDQTCQGTTEIIKAVVESEKPDLIILTGDIVCYEPADEGWATIAEIFSGFAIPWTVLMGNHDAEQKMTREEIFEFLGRQPYFIGEAGPGHIHGTGNFVLPVKGSASDKTAALIYCLDSNDYPEDTRKYGHTDWIRFDQIAWYRNSSAEQTTNNGGNPLPALAYFHIPLPEHNEIEPGDRNSYTSSRINSGFFCSAIEMGDIMGMFAGHIHSLSHVEIKSDIALGYGRVSGLNAEGRLERGGRIVRMYEGRRAFDTWLRTMSGISDLFYYPSGIFDEEEKAGPYLEATDIEIAGQGVEYTYYEYGKEYNIISVDALATPRISKVVKTGKIKNFSLDPAERDDYFGFEYDTWIKIPEDGLYRFYSYSDDGSKMFIDNQLVIDNDGSHNTTYKEGKVCLKAGYHHLKVLYFESYMGEHLELGIISRNLPEMTIPDEMLFINH